MTRMILSPTTSAPRLARQLLRATLSDDDPLRERAALLLSELVTNAVLHAGSSITIEIADRRELLRVEVTDASSAQPHPVEHPGADGGYGLVILGALADRWGVRPEGAGKTVWFELQRPPTAP